MVPHQQTAECTLHEVAAIYTKLDLLQKSNQLEGVALCKFVDFKECTHAHMFTKCLPKNFVFHL